MLYIINIYTIFVEINQQYNEFKKATRISKTPKNTAKRWRKY